MTVDMGRPPMYGPEAIQAYMDRPPMIGFPNCDKIVEDIRKKEDEDIISRILDETDVFYGGGYVEGVNVPTPACINDVIWYGVTEQEKLDFEHDGPIC